MNFFAPTLYRATIFNPIALDNGEYFPDGCIAVERDGLISFCGRTEQAHQMFPDSAIVDMRPNIIIPGLVDTHVHLPQYYAAGLGNGTLLQWLDNVVYPLEQEFLNEDFASRCSASFFAEALSKGTTAMAVYSSSLYSATNIAFQQAEKSGIKVWMGKTMMDLNAPVPLLQPAETNIRLSLSLAKEWHGKNNGQLQYILTPRFAGSCSSELLSLTAEVAASEGLAIQTHLSENKDELAFVQSLFPSAVDYTDIYDSHGLLTNTTILAHSIYLAPREIQQIKHHNCGIAHCPTSNRFLQSGIMPLDQYLKQNIKVGLGSDVAGGYSLSILNEAKEAIEQSKTLRMFSEEHSEEINVGEVFYLATLGGAKVLNAHNRIGNFAKGKEADFVVVDATSIISDYVTLEQPEKILSKVFYTSPQVIATYIHGKRVFGM